MGFRIGKNLAQTIGAQPISRKAGDRSGSGNHKGSGEQSREDKNNEAVTVEEVTAAVASESAELASAGQDIQVEMTIHDDGVPYVRITDTTGLLIREMSGAEFLKLRKKSHGDSQTRGRLLDQKL